mgnify:CR=1 FL=1|jgi:oligosaccharide repeat unit polymerase
MMISFFIVAQILNIYIAWRITKIFYSYLTISSLVLFLILIGSLINEFETYNTYEASLYLLLFNFLINAGAFCQSLLSKNTLNYAMNYKACGGNSRLLVNDLDLKIIIAALLIFFIVALYFFTTYGAPVFYDDLKFARRDIQKETFIFYRFFQYFIPISTAILYARYRIYDEKITKYIFIVCCFIALLILFGLGYKGYILWYLVFLLMLANVYSDNLFKISLGVFMLSLFAASLTTILIYSVSTSESLGLLLVRSTTIAAYGYNIVFYELYPELGNVNFAGKDLQFFLAEWKFGNNSMSQNSMAITTTLPGALIVYFGKLGALLLAPAIGFIMQSFYVSIFKYKFSPLLVVFYVYLTFSFVGVVARGTVINVFFQAIASLLLIFVFYVFLQAFLKGSGKYKYNKIHHHTIN